MKRRGAGDSLSSAGSFSGVADYYILGLFFFFFFFAKRKLKDRHLKEKLIPVNR